MQATLDAYALKPFTRALACLSKYGDEMILNATPDGVVLSCTNSSMTAHCSFKYDHEFFQSYNLGPPKPSRYGHGETSRSIRANDVEVKPMTSQVQTKSLLSILRHRNLERTAEICELSIVEGDRVPEEENEDDDVDSLESKLVIRLHCKHGVVKTHRLLLNAPTNNLVPVVTHSPTESHICVSPQTVREIIEHFPTSRGPRSDPQLIWRFDLDDVKVKTVANSLDSKGRMALSTELIVGHDDFDVYEVSTTPTTIAFHLREFNATISFAESASVPLDLRFGEPAEPLFITAELDNCEILFVISTFHVQGESESLQAMSNDNVNDSRSKRPREGDGSTGARRKSVKVVHRADRQGLDAELNSGRADSDAASRSRSDSVAALTNSRHPELEERRTANGREPLFLPHSQMSVVEEQRLRESGLGIENMNEEELAAMLEDEGEEVNADIGSQATRQVASGETYDVAMHDGYDGNRATEDGVMQENDDDSLDLLEDDDFDELGPTQFESKEGPERSFRPLFED